MPDEKQDEKKREQPGRGLYEWVQALVCSVLAAVVLFAFGARVVGVSGGSMRETLQNGDLLLVVNRPLCGDFERGDVVIAASSKSPFCSVSRMEPPETPTTRAPKANSSTAASTEHTSAWAQS